MRNIATKLALLKYFAATSRAEAQPTASIKN
jgi:hypothetical protein